jgi:hypothetical protein
MVQPVLALIAWSLVMLAWLYIQRLPTMLRYALSEARPQSGEVRRRVPAHVQWPADNYNNLLEQPMLFYALCLSVFASGQSSFTLEYLAWLYVALRVMHSVIHATCNIVVIRFGLFIAGSGVLALMCLTAISRLLGS